MALCTQEQGQKRRKPQEQGLMKSVHGVSLDEQQRAYFTCLEHHLDLWHLCGGKFMENLQEPINHTKLLRKCVGL